MALAPVRTVLGNGLAVLVRQTPKTPAVAINMAVRAGSICDPAEAPGATNLLARVIDRGTTTRTAEQVAEELDSRGITLTVVVNRHLFSLVCTCLADDFEAVFALLGDVLMRPTIPDAELATRKGEVITAIRQDQDNPAVRAVEGLMALLYDGHPYGVRQKGTIASVESLSRDRLLALHAARFAPAETTAVVVGDVSPSHAVDVAHRVFGEWNAPPPPAVALARVAAPRERRRVVFPMMNKAQADLAYGLISIRRSDPAYHAFSLMNNVLGQYALGGRLGDSIRERQGMAYYVGSVLDANVVEGPLLIRAGVSPANVSKAVASIDDELRKMAAEGLSAKELSDSRQYLVGSMPRSLETNAGIAQFLQTVEFFNLGLDYDVKLPALLGAVTLDQVNAAARTQLDPERATVVVAGPYEG
jgi:zinc protease